MIAKMLQPFIQGFHIPEGQLDYVGLLSFVSPKILETMTHVALDGDYFNEEKIEMILEALRLACPNLQTLIISISDMNDGTKVFSYLRLFKNASAKEIQIMITDTWFKNDVVFHFESAFYDILKEVPPVNFGPEFRFCIDKNSLFIQEKCKKFWQSSIDILADTRGLANYQINHTEDDETNERAILTFQYKM